MHVFIDFETYYTSDYSLRKMTTCEYLQNPLYQTIGAAVAIDKSISRWLWAEQLPHFFFRLRALQAEGKPLHMISHNIQFDGAIAAWKYGWTPNLYVDTLGMARALLAHKLRSLSLDSVAKHLGVGIKGNALAAAIGWTKEMIQRNPEMHNAYQAYANNDNNICREIFLTLRDQMPRDEFLVQDTVVRMFTHPQLTIDNNVLHPHLEQVKRKKQELLDRLEFSSNDVLMSNDKFAMELQARGIDPPTKISARTNKEAWAFAKNDKEFTALLEHEDPDVQALVAARLGHKTTIEETRTEKFIRIGTRYSWWPSREPMMPIPLRYSGAHTHRLSGGDKLNMQNLPKVTLIPGTKQVDPTSGALRKALRAPKGHVVVSIDLSQIEARVVCWIAGAHAMLDIFAQGGDPYVWQANQIGSDNRQLGKVIVLACIAENELVLTDYGLVPIQDVKDWMRVWDGVQWVQHEGVVYQGVKDVLTYDGLTATPDHKVWTEGRADPVPFGRAASALERLVCSGRDRDAVRVLEGYRSHVSASGQVKADFLHVHGVPDREVGRLAQLDLWQDQGVPLSQSAVDEPIPRAVDAGGIETNGERPQPLQQPTQQGMGTLRRAWRSVRVWLGSRSGGVGARQPRAAAVRESGNRPDGQRSGVLSGQPALGDAQRAMHEHRTKRAKTYDLLNAGPRRRFTVSNKLVSNCGFSMGAQKFMASARGYGLTLSLEEAERAVRGYRASNPEVPELWYAQNNALKALAYHSLANGSITRQSERVEFHKGFAYELRDDKTVVLEGPAGLHLKYEDLHHESTGMWFTYSGARRYIYGGKATENLVQHFARCIIMDAGIRIRKQTGFSPALQVHDENVFVVPEQHAEAFLKEAKAITVQRPRYCEDLPIACEGGIGHTYREAH